MFRQRLNSGGFVFAEFAIALPLLILLFYGLATVGLKIFYLGKIQLADYVLEEEVHDVLSRIIYDARAAKSVDLSDSAAPTFVYRTVNEIKTKIAGTTNYGTAHGDVIADKEEKRVYLIAGILGKAGSKIDYKRQIKGATNPITGGNYFGETRVIDFKCKLDEHAANVLHITLEMQSEVSGHKIKISTAVYMPGCD